MDSDLRPAATVMDAQSGVSWAAVAAGAIATAALTLLFVSFGAGLGLSAISPWSDSGVSASTFKVGAGIYLIIIGVMSSAVGGYLAGRLRTKWIGAHTNEVFFRDTAHGFLAWAFATLISATALVPTTVYLADGAASGIGGASAQAARIDPSEIYVDKLFRATSTATSATENAAGGNIVASGGPQSGAANNYNRAEILRLWTADVRHGDDVNSSDRAYLSQVVAARTGMSQIDAEKRVDSVVKEAKIAADTTRRNAAHLSFWLTAALLFGGLAASLAAAEGGTLRDGTWNDRVLTPRTT
jgi:hypothetical protein